MSKLGGQIWNPRPVAADRQKRSAKSRKRKRQIPNKKYPKNKTKQKSEKKKKKPQLKKKNTKKITNKQEIQSNTKKHLAGINFVAPRPLVRCRPTIPPCPRFSLATLNPLGAVYCPSQRISLESSSAVYANPTPSGVFPRLNSRISVLSAFAGPWVKPPPQPNWSFALCGNLFVCRF